MSQGEGFIPMSQGEGFNPMSQGEGFTPMSQGEGVHSHSSSTESASSCDAIELDNDEKKSISSALLMSE